jgi:enoyl-CoA hydratase
MAYENIIVTVDGPVCLLQLNRPKALNALNRPTMDELIDAFTIYDADDAIHCFVLHGSEKAFAAGADIKEMAEASAAEMLARDQFAKWDRIRKVRKPIIAAVSGFALGGGCELAMHCDIIIASETAKFGQPEINLGVIPGAGGTQRLTRAVGKGIAMEMILSGRMLTGEEMMRAGLVNRVVPPEVYLQEALALAHEIATKPPVAVRMAKDAILKSFDTTIETGLEYERKNFYLLFATDDMREGMKAFIEKRKPVFQGK